MKDTAIVVTTFLRDDYLFRCVESIRKFYPSVAVFVGDNGEPTGKKRRFCRKHKVEYIELPFDLGVGGTRNETLALVPKKYKYLVITEDDCVFTEATRLDELRAVLDAEPSVGLAGGHLLVPNGKGGHSEQHYEASTWIESLTHFICRIKDPELRDTNGIQYTLADLILNVFMMRRRVWERVKWDPQFKTALEHSDFFLRLKYEADSVTHTPKRTKKGEICKRRNPIRVAYVPSVTMIHDHSRQTRRYMEYRSRPVGFKLFGEKWGVEYGHSDFNKVNPVRYQTRGIDLGLRDEALERAIRIIERHKCRWWLEAGTCLGAVRQGDFIDHDQDIDLGLDERALRHWAAFLKEFQAADFELYHEWEYKGQKMELSFKYKGTLKVDLFFFRRRGQWMWHGAWGPNEREQWGFENLVFLPHVFPGELFKSLKEIVFRGKRCFVPSPPEQYLKERYGPAWGEPKVDYKYWTDCRAIDRAFLKRVKHVFIGGVWDMLHVGHINILERARSLGTKLTVGVLTDEAAEAYKPKPIIPFEQRWRVIEALGIVDRAIEQHDTDPTKDLKRLRMKPDYIVHGDDWTACPGEKYVKSHGGRIVYFPYTKGISSSAIRRRAGLTERPEKPVEEQATVEVAVEKDEPAEKIAICIKTFLRERTFFRTLDAIEKHCPVPYKLYIADDSGRMNISAAKTARYAALQAQGHEVVLLAYNVGISVGRNTLVKRVTEPTLVMMDDDLLLTDESDAISQMLTVLRHDPAVGLCASMAVGPNGSPLSGTDRYCRGLTLTNRSGLLERHSTREPEQDADGVKYVCSEQVINCFAARRELFADVQWDNRIKVGWEHLDFFLLLKNTPWKVACALDATVIHQASEHDFAYTQARRAKVNGYFFQKHGIHRVLNRYA